jgi:hypothetical protein
MRAEVRRKPAPHASTGRLAAFRFSSSAGHTKAPLPVPAQRAPPPAPVAGRRPAAHGAAVIAAAPVYPDVVRVRASETDLRVITSGQLSGVPIPAPLTDVAVHVVQAPRVRFLLANRVGAVIFAEPAVVNELRFIVAKRESRRRPGATGVFPLRFCRQCIRNRPPPPFLTAAIG